MSRYAKRQSYRPPPGPAGQVLAAAGAGDKTVTVPCRYCRTDCEMLEAFAPALSSWNAANPDAEPICKPDVIVCDDCRPQWEREKERRSARERYQLAAVCGDILGGKAHAVLPWMRKSEWAMKSIRAALQRRQERGARGDDLA